MKKKLGVRDWVDVYKVCALGDNCEAVRTAAKVASPVLRAGVHLVDLRTNQVFEVKEIACAPDGAALLLGWDRAVRLLNYHARVCSSCRTVVQRFPEAATQEG